jgi:DNA-directed RNA polymerase specialized sigma24 family protein
MTTNLQPTPLQRVVGFEVSEEIYDQLPLFAQCILDLKIEGYSEPQIASALGIAQSNVHMIFKQARHQLLKSKLHVILEARQVYRENTPIVMDGDK